MATRAPLVGILMGSVSDKPVMEEAVKALDTFNIPSEMRILSAHRTPAAVHEYVKTAPERGIPGADRRRGHVGAFSGRRRSRHRFARDRRSHQQLLARRSRFSSLDRANASRYSRGDDGNRRSRSQERGPSCRPDTRIDRLEAGEGIPSLRTTANREGAGRGCRAPERNFSSTCSSAKRQSSSTQG